MFCFATNLEFQMNEIIVEITWTQQFNGYANTPDGSKSLTSLASVSLLRNVEHRTGAEYIALFVSVRAIVPISRCVQIYYYIRPDENPFWQNVSERFIASATQWHIHNSHTHESTHIHLEHTRSNYKRDDLVLPFLSRLSQYCAFSSDRIWREHKHDASDRRWWNFCTKKLFIIIILMIMIRTCYHLRHPANE